MYAYIALNNIVWELYETMPPEDSYTPDYRARIIPLPTGVTSGWRYDPATDEFLPPLPPVEASDPITDMQLALVELYEAVMING